MGEFAASFSIFCDNRKITAGLMAELPPSLRMQAEIWVCDSGCSSHCSNSFWGMTNHGRITSRRLLVTSGQSIPILDIGDVRNAFSFPGGVRPLCVFNSPMSCISLILRRRTCFRYEQWSRRGVNSTIETRQSHCLMES